MSASSSSILLALALMLVLEGIMPFVAPSAWRNALKRVAQMNDGQLRFLGLVTIVAGLILLYFAS